MKLPTKKTKPVSDINRYTFLIYGAPKSGKTTLASKFDDPLFFAFEPGHKFIECYKLDMKSWDDVRSSVHTLLKDKDHKFKTIVFDTADIAFNLCEKYMSKKLGIEHVSDMAFGKGYAKLKDEFLSVINALGQAGFGIVFISHEQHSEVEKKSRKFTRTDSTLSGTAKKVIHGYCDLILYSFIDNDNRHLLRAKNCEDTNAGDRSGKLGEFLPNDYEEMKSRLLK